MDGDVEMRQLGTVQLRRPRPQEWRRLAALSASEFGKREHIKAQYRIGAIRRPLLWAAVMLDLAGGLGWTDDHGQALAVLRPPGLPRLRSMVVVVPVALTIAAVVVVVWFLARPLALALVAVLAVAMIDPPRFFRLRALPRSRELRKCRPRGSYALQGLVRDPAARGAGRRLAEALCDRAAAKGWVVNLDAGDEWLRDYYARLGFVPTGPPVIFPWGQVRTAMSRAPDAGGVDGVASCR